MNDEDLAEVLESMSANFQSRSMKEHKDFIENALHEFDKIPQPDIMHENFRFHDNRKFTTLLNVFIKRDKIKSWKTRWIYTEYDFMKSFISNKIREHEGGACSVDKTTRIMRLFVENEKNSIFENDRVFDEWNLPLAGSLPLWFNLLESLMYFYNGQDEKYLIAKKDLDNFYQKTNS